MKLSLSLSRVCVCMRHIGTCAYTHLNFISCCIEKHKLWILSSNVLNINIVARWHLRKATRVCAHTHMYTHTHTRTHTAQLQDEDTTLEEIH